MMNIDNDFKHGTGRDWEVKIDFERIAIGLCKTLHMLMAQRWRH